jgi:gliding motility-associated lipoprotein GldH
MADILIFAVNCPELRLILFLQALLFITACNDTVIFNEEKEVPAPWSYADTLAFQFEVRDTLPAYDINLSVQHLPDFAFANLYVMIETGFPDGKTVSGPVSLSLSDNFGQWLGKCNNELCAVTLALSEKKYFDKPGTYRIAVTQHSRKPALEGIKSVALIVQKSR